MLNFGVIASGDELHSLPTPGGQTYTGLSNYIPPVYAPTSTVAPTVSNLQVTTQLGVGTIATWDTSVNSPGTIYNITTYNANGTINSTYTQSGDLAQLGFVSLPSNGAATVQAVDTTSGLTTYGQVVYPLQQLDAFAGHHL
jgi:hypothetical protein